MLRKIRQLLCKIGIHKFKLDLMKCDYVIYDIYNEKYMVFFRRCECCGKIKEKECIKYV